MRRFGSSTERGGRGARAELDFCWAARRGAAGRGGARRCSCVGQLQEERRGTFRSRLCQSVPARRSVNARNQGLSAARFPRKSYFYRQEGMQMMPSFGDPRVPGLMVL